MEIITKMYMLEVSKIPPLGRFGMQTYGTIRRTLAFPYILDSGEPLLQVTM